MANVVFVVFAGPEFTVNLVRHFFPGFERWPNQSDLLSHIPGRPVLLCRCTSRIVKLDDSAPRKGTINTDVTEIGPLSTKRAPLVVRALGDRLYRIKCCVLTHQRFPRKEVTIIQPQNERRGRSRKVARRPHIRSVTIPVRYFTPIRCLQRHKASTGIRSVASQCCQARTLSRRCSTVMSLFDYDEICNERLLARHSHHRVRPGHMCPSPDAEGDPVKENFCCAVEAICLPTKLRAEQGTEMRPLSPESKEKEAEHLHPGRCPSHKVY